MVVSASCAKWPTRHAVNGRAFLIRQCGPGRHAQLAPRVRRESKRAATSREQKRVGDTAALGHDWIIEGTLAGVLMQAELLLATRNVLTRPWWCAGGSPHASTAGRAACPPLRARVLPPPPAA